MPVNGCLSGSARSLDASTRTLVGGLGEAMKIHKLGDLRLRAYGGLTTENNLSFYNIPGLTVDRRVYMEHHEDVRMPLSAGNKLSVGDVVREIGSGPIRVHYVGIYPGENCIVNATLCDIDYRGMAKFTRKVSPTKSQKGLVYQYSIHEAARYVSSSTVMLEIEYIRGDQCIVRVGIARPCDEISGLAESRGASNLQRLFLMEEEESDEA